MKTPKICIGLFLALLIPAAGFSQETVMASAINTQSTQVIDANTDGEEKKEDEKTFTLSGSIDTYFHTTFGTTWAGSKATGTSFANQPGFGLGMVNLVATYAGEKAGFTADLVFGPRGKDAVFGNLYTNGQGIINQMFAF
ncbi:MAG: outer membrane beta-barrel protein, partial [Bacteroidota bacterium]